MELLFGIGLIIFVALVINPMMNSKGKKEPCKLHKWTVDIQGQYYCSECKCRPGEITTDYDKPY